MTSLKTTSATEAQTPEFVPVGDQIDALHNVRALLAGAKAVVLDLPQDGAQDSLERLLELADITLFDLVAQWEAPHA